MRPKVTSRDGRRCFRISKGGHLCRSNDIRAASASPSAPFPGRYEGFSALLDRGKIARGKEKEENEERGRSNLRGLKKGERQVAA
uniref:Uncharacterized protein n=1 Tax=Sphaerodactylus townsendi TaxID=933632 RepID=A0ACB8FYP7_9SAUR